jgi:quercetin dioxygenase-like cupin family protein
MNERISNIPEMIPCRDITYRELIFTENNEIYLWRIRPGEWIYPHIHPDNDDIWYIVQGLGEYYTSSQEKRNVQTGEVSITTPGDVHGISNSGPEDMIILSVLSPLSIDVETAPGFEYPDDKPGRNLKKSLTGDSNAEPRNQHYRRTLSGSGSYAVFWMDTAAGQDWKFFRDQGL